MNPPGVSSNTQSTAEDCPCWGIQGGGDLCGVQDSLCFPQVGGKGRARSHSALGEDKGARPGPSASLVPSDTLSFTREILWSSWRTEIN